MNDKNFALPAEWRGAADSLALSAQAGKFTQARYDGYRAELLGFAAAEGLLSAGEAYFAALEGDPASPYGGDCFEPGGTDLIVETSARGTRRVVPLLLAQAAQQGNRIENFALDSGEFKRFYYAGGVYRPCPDDRLRERIASVLLQTDEALYKAGVVNEAAAAIMHRTPVGTVDLLNSNEKVVNLKNGVLDLNTLRLGFHSPGVYSTVQLDAVWTEEDAPTPAFDSLLSHICGSDPAKERLLMQFMGLCLTNVPGWRIKKALFLHGPGNTGKSVLRRFIEALLGEGNYANMDLQTLEEDRFAAAQLRGKRLAGASDMSYLRVRQLAIFKQLTGGDFVYAQEKGQKPFSFRYAPLQRASTFIYHIFGIFTFFISFLLNSSDIALLRLDFKQFIF